MHLKDDVVAAPMPWAGHLQVLPSPVHPGLGHFQSWDTASLGQPALVSHHPHCKELFQITEPKFPLFQFVPITPCPISTAPEEEALSSFLVGLPVLGFVLLSPCTSFAELGCALSPLSS